MSTGPGLTQRKLKLYFDRGGGVYAAAVTELCQRVFQLWPYEVSASHRQSLLRSVRSLARKGYPMGTMQSRRFGHELIVYRTDNRRSYATALELCKPFERVPEDERFSVRREW